jgi:lantibiotic modifying enzyme
VTVQVLQELQAPPARRRREASAGFAERALSIARHVASQGVRRDNGDVVWYTPPLEDGRPPMPLSGHLYSGSAGIAYFLAAVDDLRGTTEFRDVVVAGTAPLRRAIRRMAAEDEEATGGVPIGGMVGIGSFVYGLARAGAWLGEPVLIDSAREAARRITPARIHADDELDVIRGCAGAILALLTLDEVAPEPAADGLSPMDRACLCAEHLLRRRVSRAGAPRAWPVTGQAPNTGFAHGASGNACALLRLHQRTGDARLRDAALEAFAFERHLYDPAARNWWDTRHGRPLQLQAWCFGAPGVALARLAALRACDGAQLRMELADALDVTAHLEDPAVDHICCGNLGRADVLATAASTLDDPALLASARAIAGRAVSRARTDDDFGYIPPGNEPALKLSLIRGMSGIGYVLLRLAHPDALPSPLALE